MQTEPSSKPLDKSVILADASASIADRASLSDCLLISVRGYFNEGLTDWLTENKNTYISISAENVFSELPEPQANQTVCVLCDEVDDESLGVLRFVKHMGHTTLLFSLNVSMEQSKAANFAGAVEVIDLALAIHFVTPRLNVYFGHRHLVSLDPLFDAVTIMNEVDQGIIIFDSSGNIRWANEMSAHCLGYTSEQMKKLHAKDIVAPAGSGVDWIEHHLYECIMQGQNKTTLKIPLYKSGANRVSTDVSVKCIHREDGYLGGYLIFSDNSAAEATKKELLYLAQMDELTGLANRSLFKEFLAKAMAKAKRGGQRIALLYMDLDKFKDVNDTYGHDAGDDLLIEASRRMQEALRESDLICRLGGDEFAVVAEDIINEQDAAHIAEKISTVINQPFHIRGNKLSVGTSIGIAIYPENGANSTDLTRSADVAMYDAKASTEVDYRFFTSEMQSRVRWHMEMVTSLKTSCDSMNFQMYYQPQVDSETNRIIGIEALMRWQLKDGALISPTEFIPIAEETGLICSMGIWALETVCQQMKEWEDRGTSFANLKCAINVSAHQMSRSDFVERVNEVITRTGISPKYIELELTESAIMDDPERAIAQFKELHELGVKISIDDFGTGYSSLSYLRSLPLDKLKIDRSFVMNVGNEDDETIIKTIINLARSLGIEVIAEGVETQEQLDFLKANNCNLIQGFYFSKPLPVEQIGQLVKFKR